MNRVAPLPCAKLPAAPAVFGRWVHVWNSIDMSPCMINRSWEDGTSIPRFSAFPVHLVENARECRGERSDQLEHGDDRVTT